MSEEERILVSPFYFLFNPLPNDIILDQSKLQSFADDKLKMVQMETFVLDKTENIVGKEKNAGYQHFFLFPWMFSKGFFFRVVKSWDCFVNS